MLSARSSSNDCRQRMRRQNPGYRAPWQALHERVAPAPAGRDARDALSVYVQISDLVTKVLIRKRFRRLACEPELTNLETWF